MLGNIRGALIVALTIPFSLLFASICLDLRQIPANLLSLGALDFGMVVEGTVVMVENIIRHIGQDHEKKPVADRIRDAAHEVQRPVFYSITIIITAYLPIFTCSGWRAACFVPWPGRWRLPCLGAVIFSMTIAPVLASFLFRKEVKDWQNPVLVWLTERYQRALSWSVDHRWAMIVVVDCGHWHQRLPDVDRHDRFRISASSG